MMVNFTHDGRALSKEEWPQEIRKFVEGFEYLKWTLFFSGRLDFFIEKNGPILLCDVTLHGSGNEKEEFQYAWALRTLHQARVNDNRQALDHLRYSLFKEIGNRIAL
jgi:hypothetical protein